MYRPRYRPKVANPSYALDVAKNSRETETQDLITPFKILEKWSLEEENQENEQVRWHSEALKCLLLHIEPAGKVEYSKIVLEACQEWEASSFGLVRFFTTVRPEEANIHIEWTSEAIEGRPFEVGHTHRTVQHPGWITKAVITVVTEPEIDKQLSLQEIESRIYTTILHELGHALGLEHSKSSSDVMHHRGWRNSKLSGNDIKQLKELYSSRLPILF